MCTFESNEAYVCVCVCVCTKDQWQNTIQFIHKNAKSEICGVLKCTCVQSKNFLT